MYVRFSEKVTEEMGTKINFEFKIRITVIFTYGSKELLLFLRLSLNLKNYVKLSVNLL